MKIFEGVSRTDYQDLFRAIGLMLDERGLREVRIWEHAEGMVIQGCRAGHGNFETLMLSDDDLQELLNQAYERRKLKSQSSA